MPPIKVAHYQYDMGVGGVQEMIRFLAQYSDLYKLSKHIVVTPENGVIGKELQKWGHPVTDDTTVIKDCDIVHIHTPGHFYQHNGLDLARQYGKKVVETVHSPASSVSGADAVVCVAKFYKEEGYHYIPNGIQQQKFLKRTGHTIGRIGRLVPEKRFHHFIEVADTLKNEFPRQSFALAGAPEFKHWSYVGMIRRLRSFYRDLGLFLYPTMDESFCMVAAQAMAAEVPIITYDIPALREMTGGHAIFVPLDDVNTLVDETRKYAYNPEDFLEEHADMIKSAKERSADFDIRKVVRMYNDLYREVMG